MKMIETFKGQEGFTMVEMVMVLVLITTMFLGITQYFEVAMRNSKEQVTMDHQALLRDALDEFFVREGRLPCPANPNLAPGDADYGVEQCRTPVEVQADPDDCQNVPDGLICVDEFSRDGDQNGEEDVVMIGVVPFWTLADIVRDVPFKEGAKQDGYGFMFTYTVTENMTHDHLYSIANPVNPNIGAIYVKDENDRDVITPPGSAWYSIVSHGENGRGAWTPNGIRISSCLVPTTTTTLYPPVLSQGLVTGFDPGTGHAIFNQAELSSHPQQSEIAGNTWVRGQAGQNNPDIGEEYENCDHTDAWVTVAILSLGLNNMYNDDFLTFKHHGSQEIWQASFNSPPNELWLYNLNRGNVGVGTFTPAEKLHVAEDPMAVPDTTGHLKAETSIMAYEYCDDPDPTTGNCFDADQIGGTGSDCADPRQAMYAISGGNGVCRDVIIPDTVVGQACPAGQYLRAVSTQGNIHCETPP